MRHIQVKKSLYSKEEYAGGNSSVLLKGYSYSLQEIHKARDKGKLLCLRMETNYACNLNCLYCYSSLIRQKNNLQMSLANACNVIDQGIKLGLKSIVDLGGGEPFLYKHFWPFIEYTSSKNVTTVIFTNDLLMDSATAKRLLHLNVSVMAKLDGNKNIQDQLTGKGTYKQIKAGLDTLLEVGFNKLDGRYTRLGIAPCATKVNLRYIPEIWRFARKNNIFPNIECATEIGNATSDITLDKNDVHWLRQTVKEIDEKEFNIKWSTPYSSIPAHSCGIFLAGAAIKANRGVALCPEMPDVANLKNQSLANIIKGSSFTKARNLEKYIEEPCTSCQFLNLCLGGCRSKALVYNKSIFAFDPHCTLLTDNQKNTLNKKNY